MRKWFNDRHFRSLLKNSGYLAVSRAVAAVGGLISLAFAGRGLGVTAFGLLILVHAYVQAASSLTKFNSWQVVVRYGGPALAAGDDDRFRRATGFALGLDLTSGLLTMIGAILLLPLVAPWFGLSEDLLYYAALYCLLVPTMSAGAPSGTLRALDRFDLLSWQGTVQPNLRAVLTLVAWWQGWSLPAYLAIWFITDLAGDLVLWILAIRELRQKNLLHGLRPTLRPEGLDRGWRFALTINLNSSVNAAWGPLSRLFVGGLLHPAAAGLYRVASSIADAAQRPTDFLNKAFYPEVMRLDHRSQKPWKLMLRATAFSAMIGVAMCLLAILGGQWLLRIAFGPEFVAAYGVLVVLLGVPLVAMISFPWPAMLHALNRASVQLVSSIFGVLVYVAGLFPLVERFGLVGAGLAFLIGRIAMAALMAFALLRERRRMMAAA